MTDFQDEGGLVALTADVVSAYISNNPLPASELPSLILQVHQSICGLSGNGKSTPTEEPLAPAVSIKKSVQHDHIVCLEDGKKFKSIRRHLATSHGMTPEEYKSKWKLPDDYPMVAAEYSATRSVLAKALGLGRKPAPAIKKAAAGKPGAKRAAAAAVAAPKRKSNRAA